MIVALFGIASVGCDSGADVKVATPTEEIKVVPPPKPEQLKGAARKSVGPGSSAKVGNLGRNPNAPP